MIFSIYFKIFCSFILVSALTIRQYSKTQFSFTWEKMNVGISPASIVYMPDDGF